MGTSLYIYNLWVIVSPIIEVGILAFIIYYVLYFLRGTRSANILAGIIIAIILLTFVTENLKLGVLNGLLNGLWSIFPLALVIIFQPELRRAFAQIGSRPFARMQRREETINEVVTAVRNMSNLHIGALIIFQRQIGIRALISNGIMIDAKVSHSLIQTIFHPNTPLHDGGIAIDDNDKLAAAHIIFPLSQSATLSTSLGTRHRAALGITEETDAIAVVVSEETGKISIACRGNLRRNMSPEKLSRYLHALIVKNKGDSDMNLFANMTEENEFSESEKDVFSNE